VASFSFLSTGVGVLLLLNLSSGAFNTYD